MLRNMIRRLVGLFHSYDDKPSEPAYFDWNYPVVSYVRGADGDENLYS